ncbi:MAG: HK97 gp10 family phage protein [Desulfarculaceae bacterium]|nr:HK97 gp10 family phage protein [Desulfarculaceae bacterium]MCF8066860.1 HK97 gp10 family phage protein [Desulfarculaceae bacterium]MCF8124514.1 HK97 gp10 family phage protein [Desulfarculaceae bacterium]
MSTLRVDLSDVLTLPSDFEARVQRGTLFALQLLESYAVEEAPHATGNLVNAITIKRNEDGGTVFVTNDAPYAKYVHQGTGIWGPHKKRIYPKNKKALFWPGAAHPVRSVAGQKPNPFLDRAADLAAPEIEDFLTEVLRTV